MAGARLTALRLVGFKSFVEPTQVPIGPGLTGKERIVAHTPTKDHLHNVVVLEDAGVAGLDDHRSAGQGRELGELVLQLAGRERAHEVLGVLALDGRQDVAYAAALRITRFHTQNDHGDWDVVHHGFTAANGLHQLLVRFDDGEVTVELAD